MTKILFVYPNREAYPIIPLGISILAGILKSGGHSVDLFDITFMMSDKLDHQAREKTGVVKKVDMSNYWGAAGTVDINFKFIEKIRAFRPEIIAFSIVENNYGAARELFKTARLNSHAIIIVGGIFPTVAPYFFISDNNVDIICIGEGEYSLLQLADSVQNQTKLSNIPNLIIKKNNNTDGEINSLNAFYNWEPFTLQNWEIFDN